MSQKKTILIIEDDLITQKLIKEAFGLNYNLLQTDSLKQARKMLDSPIDLVLLDLVLTDGIGFEILPTLFEKKLPVIILSSQFDLTSKIASYKMGAIDFVPKPFSQIELFEKLNGFFNFINLIRSEAQSQIHEITIGNLSLDISSFKASIKDQTLDLSGLEFKLLHFLVKNQARVHKREALLDQVWGTDTYISDRSVDSAVSSLRKKLADWDHGIQSVYGVGYKVEKSIKNLKLVTEVKKTHQLDPETYKEIADIFLNEYPSKVTDLEKKCVEKKYTEASRLVHSLRGMVAPFNANLSLKFMGFEKNLSNQIFEYSSYIEFLSDIEEFVSGLQRDKVVVKAA